MAEEEVAASPAPSDHKRKLEDLEPEAPEQAEPSSEEPSESNGDYGAAAADLDASDEAGAKRPRLDGGPDGSASENGHQDENGDEPVKESESEPILEGSQSEAARTEPEEAEKKVSDDKPSDDAQQPSVESSEGNQGQEKEPHISETEQQEDDSSTHQEQLKADGETITRRMEVPNNKVGVLIGKAGDTIRYLQYNSGAKIQIRRDAESDPQSTMRPVEIIGTLDDIKKAEKLITAVIEEAEAGGSPALVARGLGAAQAAAAAEQIEMQVPNEKVGLIIGRGGETIKGLQARSGARIQLIPQHLSEGGELKERTVRVTGDKRQIEIAREMIKDVMNQTVRSSSLSGGFNQQGYRPRGPPGPHQWGPRGHHMSHPTSYEYQQRGPYSSHNPQYSSSYGGYNQPMGPRGWEQRPPPNMPGMHQHGGGYDYYGGQKGHSPGSAQHSAPPHASGPPHSSMGPPHSQPNYNYGQHQGPDYGHPAPYSQSANPPQSYNHGYDDHAQHHYGNTQSYQHAGAPTGYGQQQQQPPPQQYGKPPYGMPSQGPPQPYGPPRPNQTDVPYQAPAPAQSYGQGVPPQQPYQYGSTAPTQQPYSQYGSAPAAEGYNQAPPATGATYAQQGAQPVASYGQPGAAPTASYAQQGPTSGYGQYSAPQAYTDQTAANNAAYYQGSQDPASYGAAPASTAYAMPPAGQQVYAAQPTAQAQPGYEQPAQPAGAYGVQPSASVGYGGKTVSPQPQAQPQPQPGFAQYDSAQMYAAPH